MRIDYGNTVACGNVSREHVPEERALSGTRAAEDCEMSTTGIWHDADRPAVMVGIFAAADEHGVKLHGYEL